MKLLSIDSKLYKTIVGFWDAVKLNFMWLLFSLPIVTIGASTVAAYDVALKMVENNEGHVVRQFIKAFKTNWRQGIPLGLITLVGIYCCYLNFEFFEKIEGNPIWFLISGIVISLVGLVHITYAYPLSARYHNNIRNTLSNSKEMVFKYFVRTIVMWLIIGLLIFVFLLNYTLMLIGLLVGPVSIFLVVSSFASRFFKEIEKEALS